MSGFRFRWVPEREWRGAAAQVIALEMDPEAIQPAISIQRQWNHSRGLVRGRKEAGLLIEDFIQEKIDGEGRLVETAGRIHGSDEIRGQVWSADRHLAAYRAAHPDEEIVAWAGNGNLLSNPWFVAWEGGPAGCSIAWPAKKGCSRGGYITAW